MKYNEDRSDGKRILLEVRNMIDTAEDKLIKLTENFYGFMSSEKEAFIDAYNHLSDAENILNIIAFKHEK